MDSKGSATIELGIILIISILIIGITLTSFENATDKIIESQKDENIEMLISEVADNLINNPGEPENWPEIKKGTPGLGIINEEGQVIPNSLSWEKFTVLGKNYKNLVDKKLFNSKIKSSIELIPLKSSISSVKIGSNKEPNDVYSVNRLVKCDFYKKYVIKDFQSDGKCNHGHDQGEYSCNYFKIFKGNLEKSDYYLLIDDSKKYKLKFLVDTTRVVKPKAWQTTSSNKILINNKISFYDDTSAVVFIHLDEPKAKALLVGVPKDFNRNKLTYDYFRTNDCQFVLKAWY
ncbi:hypothetical protein [Methanobrevibacter sp.]|uniref:hypothetical protein n=1 Tax=Methanobrevibacter sp. TaxID=66852 RepID=UPI00388D610C